MRGAQLGHRVVAVLGQHAVVQRRGALLALAATLPAAPAFAEGAFVPAPPEQVTNYFPTVLPCKITRDGLTQVICKDAILEKKSLRELAILRNTIYARYGWDGYRKPWVRDYFHSQPWFKANPKFTYKLLSDTDKKNAHYIGTMEHSLTESDLRARREAIMISAKGNVAKLSPEDKIEIGLIDRSMGTFALDTGEARDKASESLDRIIDVKELRQLSLRDLRILRNTIYARRGRAFKSQILRDHFSGMSWYKVDPAYTDKLLSKNDTRNISLIKSVENEFGGAISDEESLQEPAIDGA